MLRSVQRSISRLSSRWWTLRTSVSRAELGRALAQVGLHLRAAPARVGHAELRELARPEAVEARRDLARERRVAVALNPLDPG